MLKHLLSLFVLLHSFQHVIAAVATVYYIGAPIEPTATATPTTTSADFLATTRISAVGTGENGKTKYDMEVIVSRWVENIDSTPRTLVSEAYTRTYNLEENVSQLVLQAPVAPYSAGVVQNAGLKQECRMDITKLTGSCVQVDEIPIGRETDSNGVLRDRIATFTATYSASFTPIATVTVNSSARAAFEHGALRTSLFVCTISFVVVLVLVM